MNCTNKEIERGFRKKRHSIFLLTFRSLYDVLYSDECRTKKSFQYVKIMLPLFRAVVKFCSTNRLLTSFSIIIINWGPNNAQGVGKNEKLTSGEWDVY